MKNKPSLVVCTTRAWNIANARKLKRGFAGQYDVRIITAPEALRSEAMDRIAPEFIFFPHWSWIVPEAIYSRHTCVIFHMTDVPYGRGGSPLQNLIVRGHRNTKITALRCTGAVDAGPVYMKRPLSLRGTAEQIFRRASSCIFFDMIPRLLTRHLIPKAQKGKPVIFRRREPKQSDLSGVRSLNEAYDHIRMLDAEGYPRAFIRTKHLLIEFSRASMNGKRLTALAQIKVRK